MLFPDPEGPTMAVVVPDLIMNEAPEKMSLTVSGAVGYLNMTSSNFIPS